MASPDVKVDALQGGVKCHRLTAIGHRGALEDRSLREKKQDKNTVKLDHVI